jgi:hypothetical protein
VSVPLVGELKLKVTVPTCVKAEEAGFHGEEKAEPVVE